MARSSPVSVSSQPASSSESEAEANEAGSDVEEAAVPRKADSGSEEEFDSGSEDGGRGKGGLKRKAPAAKVGVLSFWKDRGTITVSLDLRFNNNRITEDRESLA